MVQLVSDANKLMVDVASRVCDLVSNLDGPVLVQAGHFMLSSSIKDRIVWPCVYQEMTSFEAGLEHREAVEKAIGIFPSTSWNLGLELMSSIASKGGLAHLVTVVNDWQLIPKQWPGGAESARKSFYSRFSSPLGTYRQSLAAKGLPLSVMSNLGKHSAFLSEHWLRRRLERHVGSMRRRKLPGSEKLYEEVCGNASCIRFGESDTLDRPMLVQGTTNCAGEIVEFAYIASSSYKALINIYPLACQTPVNEGSRIGLRLFDLDDFQIINLGLSCSGEKRELDLLNAGIHVNIFSQQEDRYEKWDWN